MRLVVFDLDGTITRHDSLFPYATGYLRHRSPERFVRLPLVLPSVLLYAAGLANEGHVKSAFIRATLGGCTRYQIDDWNRQFLPHLLQQGLFAAALARIQQHQREGDRLVLLSASTDLYVPAIGSALGFAQVVCTGVRWNGDRLDGALTTANRKGPEKSRCLEALRREYPRMPTVAYGNSRHDLDHLKQVDQGFLVNGSLQARREAERLKIACLDWR